jgi:hypothetical protein
LLIAVGALAVGSVAATSALPAGARGNHNVGNDNHGNDNHGNDNHGNDNHGNDNHGNDNVVTTFDLTPSAPAIATCFPNLRATVEVTEETNQKGRDRFEIDASGLPPNQDFTVFLLEIPGSPFGAAEYIGDFSTNAEGRGGNTFELIVAEAFSSTLVNGTRVRAELNHVGFWFADPAGDDVCFGPGGGAVTPFDGDNQAGVQVMNSSNFLPGFPLSLP